MAAKRRMKLTMRSHYTIAASLLVAATLSSSNALAQRTAPSSVSTGAAPTVGYGAPQSNWSGSQSNNSNGTLQYNTQSGCKNCGVIESIREIKHEGEGSALGTLGGAAVGGTVGRQLGDGKGRVAATIAGAVIGAAAGNAAAKKHNTTTSYQTTVRMDDGSVQTLNHDGAPKWRNGQEVQLNNGVLSPR